MNTHPSRSNPWKGERERLLERMVRERERYREGA